MAIKVIVFDSDWVVNPIPNKKFTDRFKEEYPDQINVMNFFEHWVYKKCKRWDLCVKEEFPVFLEGTDWTLDSILKYWHEWDSWVDEKLIDVIKIFRGKGIPVYLATNQANTRVDYMINEMGLNTDIFTKIIASCDNNMRAEKPEKLFYERLFSIIKENIDSIKPEEILFFDDKIENIKSAEEFGIKSHHYTTFDKFSEIIKQYNI